ncbi:MAG TPA: alpha/beta fold hydrolase [Nitrososphaera sp.]|nr:alpha/beta fold hydrolase [Nitrososphaera sp.]
MVFYETISGRINVIEIPSAKPSSDAVLCIHGFPCDARIFAYTGARLSKAGYNVFSMDLPGHGKSDGPRGDLDFDACLKSINQIIMELKKTSPRVFILAHSMGSTFALWYAHLFDSIDGLILIAPYVRIGGIKRSEAEPSSMAFIRLLLGRLFVPRKRVSVAKILPGYVKIGGSQLTRMVQDRELNFEYSYRYFIDVIARRNSKVDKLANVKVPVLILQGSMDRNVYPAVSEEFFKLLRTNKKEIKVFECGHWFYDALFYSQSAEYSEEDRTKFISSMVEWLKKF